MMSHAPTKVTMGKLLPLVTAITTPSAMMSAPQRVSTKPNASTTLPGPPRAVVPTLIQDDLTAVDDPTVPGVPGAPVARLTVFGGLAGVTATRDASAVLPAVAAAAPLPG